MHRNYFFARSVVFSFFSKSLGFLIVFTCLPLAALSLNSQEFATFNYSTAISALFSIVFGPPSALLIGRFARLSYHEDMTAIRALAESSISMFVLLGLLVLPFALLGSAYLTPAGFRGSVALATVSVIATNVVSWVEVYRLGLRRDHISSAFASGNNICIILTFYFLYHTHHLSYINIVIVYFVFPLLWGLMSFLQVIASMGFAVRLTVPLHECRTAFSESLPLLKGYLADYARLNVSSLVAFNIFTAQSYAAYSTVMILVARLINPITLLSRPLVPAYIDAVFRQDRNWIVKFRWCLGIIGLLFIVMFGASLLVAIFYPLDGFRIGVVEIDKEIVRPYLVSAVLLLASGIYLVLLGSLYLSIQKMDTYSTVTATANIIAIVAGVIFVPVFGTAALLVSISICNAVAAGYLSWIFFTNPLFFGSPDSSLHGLSPGQS